jgi:hypothetical protein
MLKTFEKQRFWTALCAAGLTGARIAIARFHVEDFILVMEKRSLKL